MSSIIRHCATTLLFFFCICQVTLSSDENFYSLLGISKDADNRDIRKAFKKLALTLHPDKNPDDPEAHEKFLKITKAYEILKDQDTRKNYDLYGDKMFDDNFKRKQQYQSWNYYHESFGIYDDDAEIITLSGADFEQSVRDTYAFWFINYYSPGCSHCHTIAPVWRQVAKQLEGVIRVGAVNCEDEWRFCNEEGIPAFPSLFFYPGEEKYKGSKTVEDLVTFVLSKLRAKVEQFTASATYEDDSLKLLVFCTPEDDDCPDSDALKKVAHILDGLVKVVSVNCELYSQFCRNIGIVSGVAFFNSALKREAARLISGSNYLEIARQVFAQLPQIPLISSEDFTQLQQALANFQSPNALLIFVDSASSVETEQDLELRRLPALLSRLKLGRVDCSLSQTLCKSFYLPKYPSVVVFKVGGAYEVYNGRFTAADIATFARESTLAPTLRTLTPSNFPAALQDGFPWLIDFYAPWCPPCKRLMPEFRKASKLVGGVVRFGSLDCTSFNELCARYNVRAYPTVIFYNETTPHTFNGQHDAEALAEFVEDVLKPPVTKITHESFKRTVGSKNADELWLVDYYAPWCGPCNQLAPHWRKMAKNLRALPNVHVVTVDCQAEYQLCQEQNVQSYPTIRLYPIGSRGIQRSVQYGKYQRDWQSLLAWVWHYLPSSVVVLTGSQLESSVWVGKESWVVDFYAPWCGPCNTLVPDLELAAKVLEGRVKFAKIDCDNHYAACNKAGIRAYPTLRFYTGEMEQKSRRDPYGVVMPHTNQKVITEWVEERLAAAAVHGNRRDEL